MDPETGERKDPNIPRVTYATAQKMRASISHKFGRGYKIGTQMWTEHPLQLETYMGNPSLSVVVSDYMISLRRQKVNEKSVIFGCIKLTHSIFLLGPGRSHRDKCTRY